MYIVSVDRPGLPLFVIHPCHSHAFHVADLLKRVCRLRSESLSGQDSVLNNDITL